MRPFWSPTTTRAANAKFLPPFTTLATRLIATSLSTISDCSRSSSRPLRPPRSPRSRAMSVSLEFQTALAGGFGERFHAAMEQVAAAVEDDVGDASLLRALGDELADGGRRLGLAALDAFFERRGMGQRDALGVV